MKFTTATKPLTDGLNLIVINSNITPYYQRSCVVQLIASTDTLIINTEADGVLSEVQLHGKSDDAEANECRLIDALTFKNLINTIDASVIELDFVSGGIKVIAGRSQFSIPQIIDSDELRLNAPIVVETANVDKIIDIDKESWKLIKNDQLYAISKSILHPVYTYAWISETNDVLVGDVTTGFFTHSNKGNFGIPTCLLKETVINMIDSFPDGGKINVVGDHFVIVANTDGFMLRSEFIPAYESNPDIGSYNSDMLFDLMNTDADSVISFNTAALVKLINQVELLNKNQSTISLTFEPGVIKLATANINSEISCNGSFASNLTLKFKIKPIKTALAHLGADVRISPIMQGDMVVGITLTNDIVTVILAGEDN